jgi:hypothetical protein
MPWPLAKIQLFAHTLRTVALTRFKNRCGSSPQIAVPHVSSGVITFDSYHKMHAFRLQSLIHRYDIHSLIHRYDICICCVCLLFLSESRFNARINRQVQTQLERVRAQNADDAAQHAAAIDVLLADIAAQKAIVAQKKQVWEHKKDNYCLIVSCG